MNYVHPKTSSPARIALLLSAVLIATELCGCSGQQIVGGETSPWPASPDSILSGRATGGEQPIVGGTVNLYTTTTSSSGTGYANGGTLQATTTTGSDGQFSINTSSYTCPTGQQVYISINGGSSGGYTSNPQILELAGLGPCGSLPGYVNLNEVTTVASAYALGNFMSIDSSGFVHISAPSANNNASTGTTSAAAGLPHAFQNIANLINYQYGTALAAVPSPGPGGSVGVVPQAEINTIADILYTCVNSNGGSGSDGSACAKMFALMPSRSGTEPANTLQAAMNLASNPTANVATLYALLPAQPAFAPVLTSAPFDWDIAISYPISVYPTGTTSSYPNFITLDANDDVYVLNPNASAATAANLYAFTSNGSNTYVNQTAIASTYAAGLREMAADNTSDLWLATNSNAALQLNTQTGALTSTSTLTVLNSTAVAVDANNNVWFGMNRNNTININEIPYTSGAFGTPVALNTSGNGAGAVTDMAIDANQNIWFSSNVAGTAYVLANNNSFPYSPSYTTGSNFSVSGLITTLTGSLPIGLAVDSAGNGWTATTSSAALNKITPSFSTHGALTALPSTPTAAYTTPALVSAEYPEVDGDGIVWIPQLGGNGIAAFNSATSAYLTAGLKPCRVQHSGNVYTCTATGTLGTIGDARIARVDSTGSLWIANSNTQTLLQIIGTAAPTWPLLATGLPGTLPQNPPSTPSSYSVNIADYSYICSNGLPSPACIESFNAAIADAADYLNKYPTATYNINLNGGTFDLSAETRITNPNALAVINVGGIWPATGGSLNFIGSSGVPTILLTDNSLTTIRGWGISHIHFSYITFERDRPTTTMGIVTSISTAGQLSMTVPPGGFLDPLTLFNNAISDNGGTELNTEYIRAYTNTSDPQLVDLTDNSQIPWGRGTVCPSSSISPTVGYCEPTLQPDGKTWVLYFNGSSKVAASDAYMPNGTSGVGNFVGIKMEGAGQAYYFDNWNTTPPTTGTDVGFDHCIWQDMSRGIWFNITKPYVTNSSIVRRPAIGGQNYTMSTPTGGPQFQSGQANLNIQAHVNNFSATNTGDDTIAIFNDNNGGTTTIGAGSLFENTVIRGSFARDINLFNSCYVAVPMPQDAGSPTNASNISNCFSTDNGTNGFDYPIYYKGCVSDTTGSGNTNNSPCYPWPGSTNVPPTGPEL